MAQQIWTIFEQVVKKYTIQDAVDAARVKAGGSNLCLDAIKGRDRSTPITLVELNHLSDLILLDTAIHA
ncbi:hypothetical protein AVU38_gp103 [Ralstonia phage RSL2]|uniref:Uncharacterized protein n=1 Tax=Ralstonia phage RSL2 TaxID=1585840 RepID=A0A0A8JB86_9CAUD|nr:hypothetical protein AVU38_gp103 [Ralstonia phage RSL2]BAQ02631.1 hypothetical protein [Ralstonia phage RSL2]